MSGSLAVNLCTNVPVSASSLISARCVVGVKNGALSLLLITLIVIVAVPGREPPN
jgi:hypothetical protein